LHSFRASLLKGVLLLAVSASALAAEPRTIHIRQEAAPRLDVFYHRATSNATGAVLGGLIGAGIQAGIESDKDRDKLAAIRLHVPGDAWQEIFVKALDEALRSKDIEPTWVEGKDNADAAPPDLHLSLFETSYGFRMMDTATALMAAYVEFDAAYSTKPVETRRKSAREAFFVTGKQQASYEDLVADGARVQTEVEHVLEQAARRLANKIAYNVK
jgi:hypothetical protein